MTIDHSLLTTSITIMKAWEHTDYSRIAEAISYIQSNFKTKPGWKEIAERTGLSPDDFQMLLTGWAGISPEKFLQYITVQYARKMLREKGAVNFETYFETGIPRTEGLQDRLITIGRMVPGEYKNGGENLSIHYSVSESPFGKILVASACKGICYIAFTDNEQEAVKELQTKFPNAAYRQMEDPVQQNVHCIFNRDRSGLQPIRLHVKGTEFQIKVWEALLKIPVGRLSTYGSIAREINLPNAGRAVGSAIGDNPVAFLIPCHRVVQSTGVLGGFRWGTVRKAAMIGWEAAQVNNN